MVSYEFHFQKPRILAKCVFPVIFDSTVWLNASGLIILLHPTRGLVNLYVTTFRLKYIDSINEKMLYNLWIKQQLAVTVTH